jgi:hypothetical protein
VVHLQSGGDVEETTRQLAAGTPMLRSHSAPLWLWAAKCHVSCAEFR